MGRLGRKEKKVMTQEELNKSLENNLTCGFKVGDEVITSDGKVGIITRICTCDRCRERGFYEPVVNFIVDGDIGYITDTDKKDNFRSFYKIGDKIFGNIDKGYRNTIMSLIDILIRARSSDNDDIYTFLNSERKRDMSNNTERFRCGYIACLNNLEDFLNKEHGRDD